MKHRNKCTIILRFSYIDTPPLLCYAELLLNPPKKTMSSYQLGKVGKHCITLPLDTTYIQLWRGSYAEGSAKQHHSRNHSPTIITSGECGILICPNREWAYLTLLKWLEVNCLLRVDHYATKDNEPDICSLNSTNTWIFSGEPARVAPHPWFLRQRQLSILQTKT